MGKKPNPLPLLTLFSLISLSCFGRLAGVDNSKMVYQLYNPDGGHFYTQSRAQRDSAASHGWLDEQSLNSFFMFSTQQPGTVPVHRLYLQQYDADGRPSTSLRYYTLSDRERDILHSEHGWSIENDEGFLYPMTAPKPSNTAEVFHVYNPNTGDHLFTINRTVLENPSRFLQCSPSPCQRNGSLGYAPLGGKYVMAAFGDSHTMASNAVANSAHGLAGRFKFFGNPNAVLYNLFENFPYSWSTGTVPSINSHLNRLQSYFGGPDHVLARNFAEVGAVLGNISYRGQTSPAVETQLSLAERENMKLDYITFGVGGNNLCRSNGSASEIEKFKSDLKKALDRLVKLLATNGKINVLSAPDLGSLYEGAKYFVYPSNGGRSCSQIWAEDPVFTLFNFCPNLTQLARGSGTSAQLTRHSMAYNRAIRDVVATYGTKVRLKSVFTQGIHSSELSPIDCFHPSAKGQQKLADRAW